MGIPSTLAPTFDDDPESRSTCPDCKESPHGISPRCCSHVNTDSSSCLDCGADITGEIASLGSEAS
jgi:hypothetical protein